MTRMSRLTDYCVRAVSPEIWVTHREGSHPEVDGRGAERGTGSVVFAGFDDIQYPAESGYRGRQAQRAGGEGDDLLDFLS